MYSDNETELIKCVEKLNQLEIYLKTLEKQMRMLEAENDFLRAENKKYQRKLSGIFESKLGKAGMKIYRLGMHILQKR